MIKLGWLPCLSKGLPAQNTFCQIISDGTDGFSLDEIVFSGMERSERVKKSNLWEKEGDNDSQ